MKKLVFIAFVLLFAVAGWGVATTQAAENPPPAVQQLAKPNSFVNAYAGCSGDDLYVTITSGVAPFSISTSNTTASTPRSGLGAGTTVLLGPDNWQQLKVTDATNSQINLGNFICVHLNGSIIVPAGAPSNTAGQANPYPSTKTVSGLGTRISDINVTINDIGHTFTDDLEIMLVSPAGTGVILMNDACGSYGDNFSFTFDDEAFNTLSDSGWCPSGSVRPGSFGTTRFPFPAPTPVGTFLSFFDGQNPNGTWSLYVNDDEANDIGDIGSWSLDIRTQLQAAASCNGDNMTLTISSGDGPFNIPGLFTNIGIGTYTLNGPDTWTITIQETTGDRETLNLGTFTCVNLNGSIIIPGGAPSNSLGQANPYPSTKAVSGLGIITDVNVRINGLGHTFLDDVEILLVSPEGTAVVLMADACGPDGKLLNLVFDDESANVLPDNSGCVSKTYRPTRYSTQSFPAPAPLPNGTTLSAFDGENPNGTWQLYVNDDASGDYGDIESWSLEFETVPSASIRRHNVFASAQNEGNSGLTPYYFVIELSASSNKTITVNYVTNDGTATVADNDYQAKNSSVSFAPGETKKNIKINAVGDTIYEGNQTFTVLLSGATNATINTSKNQITGTLVNDDAKPTAFIRKHSILPDVQNEGDSGFTAYYFVVELTNLSDQTITVSYVTSDGTATLTDNDYRDNDRTLTFIPRQKNKAIKVLGVGDTKVEPDESFRVVLTSATNAQIDLNNKQVKGTLINDDGGASMEFGVPMAVVEAGDPQVFRAGNWTSQPAEYASGGGYLYSSGAEGDSLSLNFTGTSVGVMLVNHPALSDLVIEVDGVPLQVRDTHGEPRFGQIAYIRNLLAGQHVLRVYGADGVAAVDAFLVPDGSVVEPTPVPYNPTPIPSPTMPRFLAEVVSLPLYENFDDGGLNWTTSGAWSLSATGANGNYGFAATGTNAITTLTYSRPIRLYAVNPRLTFDTRLNTSVSLGVIEISTDNLNWTAAHMVAQSPDWTTQTVDLSRFKNQVIFLRFNWLSYLPQNGMSTGDVWQIDNLSIREALDPIPTRIPPTRGPESTPVPGPDGQIPTPTPASIDDIRGGRN